MKNRIKLFYAKVVFGIRKSLNQKIVFETIHFIKSILTVKIKKYDLIILDDFSPNILSGFRTAEFSFLLKNIEKSALYSMIRTKLNRRREDINYFISSEKEFEIYKLEFINSAGVQSDQVQPFFTWTKIKANLAYIVFLENAYSQIDYLEKNNIRFILELYPGGGFLLLTEGEQYDKLKRVMLSPCFVHVIVTQKVTHRFLLENRICPEDKISFKYWGVSADSFFNLPAKSIRYGVNKDTIDICFTAGKYMKQGLDKGYDIFIAAAHMLLSTNNIFQFHIVGGFNENDVSIDARYKSHFHFYGFLKSKDFISYYEDKDIFVSPNRPNTLAQGAFDGFPTGTCNEAGQNGLCMIFSDPLYSNYYFEDYKDAIFTENDASQIADIIQQLSKSPDLIYQIGDHGKKTLMKIEPKDQLEFRLSLINKFINND